MFGMQSHARIVVLIALIALSPTTSAQPGEARFLPLGEMSPVYDIVGVVVEPEGAPLPTTVVSAVGQSGELTDSRTTRTDRFGRFTFSDLAEIEYWTVVAEHPRFAFADHHGGQVQLKLPRSPDAPAIRITMIKAHSYRGQLLDIDGTPASGARVLNAGNSMRVVGGELQQQANETVTDDEGYFFLTHLGTEKPGLFFWYGERPMSYVGPDHLPTDHVFRMFAGMTMMGCVTDEEGRHVPGVSLVSNGGRLNGQSYGPWFSVSDEDGHFSLRGLPYFRHFEGDDTSAHSVVIEDSRYKDDLYTVYLTPEMTLPFVEIVLRDSSVPGDRKLVKVGVASKAEVGSVLVRTSEPMQSDSEVRRPRVTLESVREQEPHYREREALEGPGEARFPDVPPGEYRVTARTVSQAFRPQTVRVSALRETKVTLEPGPAHLEGRIGGHTTDSPQTSVHWGNYDENRELLSAGSTPVLADATYAIRGLLPGEVSLQLSAGEVWFGSETTEVRAGPNRFDLSLPSNRITGRIDEYDPKYRREHQGDIRLTQTSDVLDGRPLHAEIHVNDEGGFSIDHLPPGEFTLQYREPVKNLNIRETVVLAGNNDVVHVDIVAPVDLGMLTGTVSGLPSPGKDERSVFINRFNIATLMSDGEDYSWTHYAAGKIDAESGHFEISNVEPGEHALQVSERGRVILWRTGIEVRPNTRTQIDLVVSEMATVTFRFLSDRPIHGRRIEYEVRTADDRFYPVSVSFNNSATAGDTVDTSMNAQMDPGEYVVHANLGGERVSVPFSVVPGGEDVTVEVRAP